MALHRSDTTAWKSGFSVCSHLSLLNSGSPWYAKHCLNNSLSILLLQDCGHIIVQLKNAVNADCLWVMVNKNLPLARFSKCAVCLAVETFLIHLNYKTRQYIGLTCKLAKCLNVEGKVGETQFNGYPTVLCVV